MTATELIKTHLYVTKDGIEDVQDSVEYVRDVMIKFAKHHVQEALKCALDEVPYGSSTDTISYEDVVGILDCYDLDQIV